MALVFVGTDHDWSSWMGVFDFNFLDNGGACVAPIKPLTKLFFGLLIPLFCLLQVSAGVACHLVFSLADCVTA